LLPNVIEHVRRSGYEPALYGVPAEDGGLVSWADERFAGEIGRGFGIAVTHGAVDAIERLLAVHLTRGDAVAVEDPCFLAHISTLRLNGFTAVPVAVDAAGMAARGLEIALERGRVR
jgi:DNA-binding transcriptional MocR family regulator